MISIDLIKNHPNSITRCAEIWYEVLGAKWVPDIPVERVIQRFSEHLNDDTLPLTIVALDVGKPVGMCSLRENDGIRQDLKPWLGSLVVDPAYQKQGIGTMLIEAIKNKARDLGFNNLYLFAFDPTIPDYYSRLGWTVIGMDEFKGYPVTVMKILI
ncbi:GNAT family N-acetyltransferase [Legionella bononiensis]|uniref:GNAT family N-acetyltransferase n=1 Tax=Legionella bononiensis TaxID=2793102 RepID=A0ABS1WC41_9GAMM|nr:GNAT family N-acetyltransferase [Legionella bononiensis]MBL7479186.1 GNAT family N-acetyltransferase [Legionella bononiensis]MBL7526922.1 GNAT family N-acetyltransferase [Legionella bononiensis]MBL7563836.1 GNAT family N-acetyltransferase [Legionella bononiensis]